MKILWLGYAWITDITNYSINFTKARGDSHHKLSIQTLQDIVESKRAVTRGLSVYYNPLADEIKNFIKPQEGGTAEGLKPTNTVLINKVIPLLMEYFSGKIDIVSSVFDGSGLSVKYNSVFHKWEINQE